MNSLDMQPVFIELDEACRKEQFDRAEAWLKNVQLTQASFRQLLEDTVEKIEEPHIKDYLSTMLQHAKEHEQQAENLFAVIGRKPSTIRVKLGELAGKGRELLADMIALSGGAKGPWQDVHQLYISNLNSMSAFAVAEQLGLALGIPAIVDITYPVISQKSTDHLLLQEVALEMCSMSILYRQGF
jgi:ferritin-like metal-binding protein YciE